MRAPHLGLVIFPINVTIVPATYTHQKEFRRTFQRSSDASFIPACCVASLVPSEPTSLVGRAMHLPPPAPLRL